VQLATSVMNTNIDMLHASISIVFLILKEALTILGTIYVSSRIFLLYIGEISPKVAWTLCWNKKSYSDFDVASVCRMQMVESLFNKHQKFKSCFPFEA